MYFHFTIAFFITSFFSIHGNPVQKSVYETIKLSAGDEHFKCPYVRTTNLLEPKPEVLSKCISFTAAQSLTALDQSNVQDGLCLLYYNNFKHLCYVSNNNSDITQKLLSNEQVEKIPTTYQDGANQVCAILKNMQFFFEDTKPGIEVVHRYFEDINKCVRICTDLDLNVKPICSLTAFMINITTTILNQSHNLVPVDTKTEKEMIPKKNPPLIGNNKDEQDNSKKQNEQSTPPLTEPVADSRDTSRIQSDDVKTHSGADKKQNEAGGAQQSLETNNDLPSGRVLVPQEQSSGSQTNLSINETQTAQKTLTVNTTGVKPQTNAEEDRWKIFNHNAMVEQSNTNEHGEQSVAPKAQPSSSDDSVNNQGKNYIELSRNQAPLQSTVRTENKDELHKNDEQSSVNTQQQKLGPQISNNLNTDRKNDDGTAQKSDTGKPPEEKLNGKVESHVEGKLIPNQNHNSVENNVANTQEVVGNAQQAPSPANALPKDDNSKKNQDNKLSTQVDDVMEHAGESPLDTNQMQPDYTDDDLEQGFDLDSNINEAQPKSSEDKTKPVEKSKPLEIVEDGGPSFAANYQNQSIDDSDSYFFSYFMMVCIMFICGYVAYHNKQKILALVVEGRKGRRSSRTRRPNSANYRKLDSNLEEAVTSSCNKNATQVIY